MVPVPHVGCTPLTLTKTLQTGQKDFVTSQALEGETICSLESWLRRRYDGFLKLYSQEEIYARSTNFDRTLISARATLTGLCTNHRLHHIPIHTSPLEKDIMLYREHTECDKSTQNKKLLEETQFIKRKLEDNKDLLEYLSLHTGWPILSFLQLAILYDTIVTEEFYNMTLPHWTKAVFPGGQFGQLRNFSPCWIVLTSR